MDIRDKCPGALIPNIELTSSVVLEKSHLIFLSLCYSSITRDNNPCSKGLLHRLKTMYIKCTWHAAWSIAGSQWLNATLLWPLVWVSIVSSMSGISKLIDECSGVCNSCFPCLKKNWSPVSALIWSWSYQEHVMIHLKWKRPPWILIYIAKLGVLKMTILCKTITDNFKLQHLWSKTVLQGKQLLFRQWIFCKAAILMHA